MIEVDESDVEDDLFPATAKTEQRSVSDFLQKITIIIIQNYSCMFSYTLEIQHT